MRRCGIALAVASASLAFAATAMFGASPASAQEAVAERRVEARVDPRVELLSVVFRLAGNPEYSQGKVDSYTRAVEAQFGKLRGHAVVKHAAALRREHGVSYDAVMSLAVHLDDEFNLAMPPEKSERLDKRWPADEVKVFVAELRAFADEGDARGFFRAQRELYELTARRMQVVIEKHMRLAWFDAFFGARPSARFELTLGLLNGGGCYGASVRRADGAQELYCILGVWMTDADGKPAFSENVVPTIVHEFCHSYCNALMDAHADELAGPGQRIWPHVADAMRAQAYGGIQTMMRESLVRACVVRYQAAEGGDAAAKREIAEQLDRSFLWTGELAGLLAEYEGNRAKYPTLAAFMPRVVQFFDNYAPKLAERTAAAPKVVSMTPANGATDVDPALTALTVTFDRPMLDQAWAVVGGGPHFPKVAGKPHYDATRRILTIPVELQPSWSYDLWLNRGKYDSFQSAERVKLEPVHVAFQTRAKCPSPCCRKPFGRDLSAERLK